MQPACQRHGIGIPSCLCWSLWLDDRPSLPGGRFFPAHSTRLAGQTTSRHRSRRAPPPFFDVVRNLLRGLPAGRIPAADCYLALCSRPRHHLSKAIPSPMTFAPDSASATILPALGVPSMQQIGPVDMSGGFDDEMARQFGVPLSQARPAPVAQTVTVAQPVSVAPPAGLIQPVGRSGMKPALTCGRITDMARPVVLQAGPVQAEALIAPSGTKSGSAGPIPAPAGPSGAPGSAPDIARIPAAAPIAAAGRPICANAASQIAAPIMPPVQDDAGSDATLPRIALAPGSSSEALPAASPSEPGVAARGAPSKGATTSPAVPRVLTDRHPASIPDTSVVTHGAAEVTVSSNPALTPEPTAVATPSTLDPMAARAGVTPAFPRTDLAAAPVNRPTPAAATTTPVRTSAARAAPDATRAHSAGTGTADPAPRASDLGDGMAVPTAPALPSMTPTITAHGERGASVATALPMSDGVAQIGPGAPADAHHATAQAGTLTASSGTESSAAPTGPDPGAGGSAEPIVQGASPPTASLSSLLHAALPGPASPSAPMQAGGGIAVTAAGLAPAVADSATVRLHPAAMGEPATARMTLRLDPAELGSLDISIHTRTDGSQAVHIAVERADTLGMLQRDQGQLHAALERAGVQPQTPKLELQLTLAEQRPATGSPGADTSSPQQQASNTPGGRQDPGGAQTPQNGARNPNDQTWTSADPAATGGGRSLASMVGLNIIA